MLFHERGLQVEAAPHGQEPAGRNRHPAPQGPRQVRCGAPDEGPEVTGCLWLAAVDGDGPKSNSCCMAAMTAEMMASTFLC